MRKSKLKFLPNLGILLAYSLLTGALLYFHEPWRDEAQQWLFVKNQSFASMLSSLHYEGHPALWYLLIWPLTRLGFGFASVLVLHAALVLLCGWLIVYRSPFPYFLKALFLFSMPLGYQFNAISRSYILICVLLFLIALIFPDRHGKYKGIYGILLLLLVNTHLLAAAIAAVLILYDFLTLFHRNMGFRAWLDSPKRKGFLITFVFFCAGILLLYLSLRGERDFHQGKKIGAGSFLSKEFFSSAFVILRGGMNGNLWQGCTYLFSALRSDSFLGKGLIIFIDSALAVPIFVMLLHRFKPAFLVGLFCFFYSAFSVMGAPLSYWNEGLVFPLFIFAFWIEKTTPGELSGVESKWNRLAEKLRFGKGKIAEGCALVVLAVNTAAMALSVYGDIRYPYSQAYAAARYLTQAGYDTADSCMVTPDVAQAGAILPYLSDIRYFSLPGWPGKISYSTWDKKYVAYHPDEKTIFSFARREYDQYGKTPLVVYDVKAKNVPDDFTCIYSGAGKHTFVKNEQFSIYTLRQTTHN